MPAPQGKIKEYSIYSSALDEELELLVYFPESFSPLYKYTLLIAQDGRDYFQLGRIGRAADELLYNKEMQNTIIVGIPYKNVMDRRTKYHPDGEKQAAYIRFLASELVPFLDQEFPVYNMARARVLIGDSLGATVSLQAALQYPHTFGSVILQSPYVDGKVLAAVEKFADPSLIDIYHVIGKGETEVPVTSGGKQNFIDPNRELNKLIEKKDFSYFYEEFEGEHTWKYWQKDLKRALGKVLAP
ncbi:alpha/beta hydrolase [Peribacillus sp. SCS-37]|uniref:alpha/beta hydrolase n=1 Tax=Paraperibacillus esterisolvens TaxID=3115296 RepID=UPI003905BCAB